MTLDSADLAVCATVWARDLDSEAVLLFLGGVRVGLFFLTF